MHNPINVLFLAAEAEPYVKVGGLGDVAGSLPQALRALSSKATDGQDLDVRLVLPFHPVLRSKIPSLRPLSPFSLKNSHGDLTVEAFETYLNDMPVYLIGGEPIDSSGSVYSSNPETDREKYTFFSLAALGLTRQLGWRPDIVHVNDWHTALSAYGLLVQHWQDGGPRPASLLTVHNLPFLGPDVDTTLEEYGFPLAQTDLPDWARRKPLPLGLWSADAIVAVSPTYAKEMLSPDYGSGLEEYLSAKRSIITGILNGLDVDSFNPATDAAIASNYTRMSLEERSANKFGLARMLGLSTNLDIPLFGVVSRLEPQKGIDLAIKGLRKFRDDPWQYVVLGAGDPKLERSARRLANDFPERVRFENRYDDALARQIYAGADALLMPSRYEPCGLSQMIAMRYGCVPVVRAVGGLHDTVTDGETGFVFVKDSLKDFVATLRRVLKTYQNPETWQRLQLNGMSKDFSWQASARKYVEIYRRILAVRS